MRSKSPRSHFGLVFAFTNPKRQRGRFFLGPNLRRNKKVPGRWGQGLVVKTRVREVVCLSRCRSSRACC